MKPLFKNTTTYNSENYNEFIKFHGKKFSFSYNTYNIIMLILLLYCIIFNIINLHFVFALLFILLAGLLIYLRIYLPVKRHDKTKKKYENNKKANYTFTFYRYYFTLENETFYYFKLYKVFETKDYFYLYVNYDNAILVNKNGFTVGTAKEFSKFIKKTCFLNYKKQA